jgi:ribosomal protein L39E
VRFNLAVRLALEYQREIPDWVTKRAEESLAFFRLRRADEADSADDTVGTAQNVIQRALRLIGVLKPGEKPAPFDEAGALTALNEMLDGWERSGVDLTHTTLTITDAIALDASWIEGIRFNLAVRLAHEYERPVPEWVSVQAVDALTRFMGPLAQVVKETDAPDDRTAKAFIKRAMRRLKYIKAGEEPSSRELNEALETLNQMLHAWELVGLIQGHTDLALTDVLTIPDSHLKGVTLLLAVDLSDTFDIALPEMVFLQAERQRRAMQSAYNDPPIVGVDEGLLHMAANRGKSW